MRHIDDMWRSFSQNIPSDYPPLVREQTRKVFFGGAAMMFRFISTAHLNQNKASPTYEEDVEDEAQERVESLTLEISDHIKKPHG